MDSAKWDLYNALDSEVGQAGIMKRFSLKDLREILQAEGKQVNTGWSKPYLADMLLEVITRREDADVRKRSATRAGAIVISSNGGKHVLHLQERVEFGIAFNKGDALEASRVLTKEDAKLLLKVATAILAG